MRNSVFVEGNYALIEVEARYTKDKKEHKRVVIDADFLPVVADKAGSLWQVEMKKEHYQAPKEINDIYREEKDGSKTYLRNHIIGAVEGENVLNIDGNPLNCTYGNLFLQSEWKEDNKSLLGYHRRQNKGSGDSAK
ncbi:hypothetical protein GT022_20045 [Agaribacter marinus]|uniref:HNH endonuclease n=1 Tax=Virgibacillus salarius TaxID=447199 RepID=A0A941DZQ0_9BACI|nr:hypothetical protein [Virgibacillus salarius]MBR7798296.1 hypothetical protein [Virgibacillus salarius]NAZ11005.1 hypothetical protein [Agaribacter marinus]